MPKNFQTSQYDEPIAFDGWTEVEVDGETFRIEIERAHMEEDTGKSLHVGGATGRIHGADYSLVDYNRAGIPLIEIVTKPIDGTGDKAPLVARAYVAHLRELLLGLGVSDVRMEQGSLRCDVNLSLRAVAGRAARHPHRDQERQLAALGRAGGALRDRPPGGDPRRRRHRSSRRPGTGTRTPGSPRPGREKSDAEDYRYFPEPDLVPVAPVAASGSRSCGRRCPSRPRERRARLQAAWGFSDLEMRDTVGAGALLLVEQTVAAGASPQAARKWWLSELARRANEQGVDLVDAAGHARPTWPGSRRWSTRAGSTTSSPARSSTACWPARARPTRWSPPAASRSSPTTARCRPRSTAPSRPTPTSPTRSATARSPRPVR